jgi:phage gp29-like protein
MANGFPGGGQNGFGGHPLSSPFAQRGMGPPPAMSPQTAQSLIVDALGAPMLRNQGLQDPAFAQYGDRLRGQNPADVAATVVREIPLTTVNTSWDISLVRQALQSLVIGLFDQPAQLVESIVGDSRVQSAMESRTGALLGAPVKFRIPKRFRKDPMAQKCMSAWERMWPMIGSEPILAELLQWAVHLGFGVAQLHWDTTGKYWRPYLQVWNPRYMYYHWLYRVYVAIGLDGQFPIFGGDGHWVLHAPHSEYRGWIRGAMRAVAPWWLARNYALRDWARYSERNGMPWVKGKTPAAADPIQIQQFRQALSMLGQESVMQVPQGVDDMHSYDIELMESAVGEASTGFEKLITMCNGEITLALMSQNLTTEVKEGSFAAARVHADVRQQIIQADARALADTIYTQIARPFALFNFGNADYAPLIQWDVSPPEDAKMQSEVFKNFADALYVMRRGGIQVNDIEGLAKSFGLNMSLADIQMVGPLSGGMGPSA